MRHVVYDISDVAMYACWGAFGLTWFVGMRRSGGAAVEREQGRDRSSWLGGVLAVLVLTTPAAVWRHVSVGSPLVRIVGMLVLLPATAAALWSRGALGTMWSSRARAQTGHQLRTTGPYAITRHPIYTAVLGMLIGTTVAQGFGRWIVVLAGVGVILALKVRAEERLLSAEFPLAYARYRAAVPTLLPRLPGRRRAGGA